jgi:DNA-binding transcriptional ArsR family regulator
MSAVLKFTPDRTRQATDNKKTWLDHLVKSEAEAREEIQAYARKLAEQYERVAAITEHARKLGEHAITLQEQAEEREREFNRVAARNVDLERRFNRLVDRWRRDTRRLSSVTQMALHPAYQKIIGMGWSAVPLILREMQDRGGHWLWALHAITDEDPAPEGATFHEAVQAWLEWGREHNYLT